MQRLIAALALAVLAACAPMREEHGFVGVKGHTLTLGGAPYRFAGANMWYAAYLGAHDPARLERELDLMRAEGLTNVRLLGAAEASPLRDSVKETFRDRSGRYNETLLRGLDRALDEIGKRDMRAVIYLNNFWEWSGGMSTYLYWTNGGKIVDPADPAAKWPAYPLFTMQFYASAPANALYRDYIRAVVTRRNTVNGRYYRDDPAIMSWQLANEPRPGYRNEPGLADMPGFYRWIDDTAGYVKSLDRHHLVSSGNEGIAGCADDPACYRRAHATRNIDYLTFHLWPFNWGWYDPKDEAGTMERTLSKSREYLDRHLADARALDKPIVLEEFGLPRAAGAIGPESATGARERFMRFIYTAVETDAAADGPLAGSNFWAWGGAGRAQHPDGVWRPGDASYLGDPPQEPQGQNSLFDTDTASLSIMAQHAATLRTLEHGATR